MKNNIESLEHLKDKNGKITVHIDEGPILEDGIADQINEILTKGICIHYKVRIIQNYFKREEGSVPNTIIKGKGTHYYFISNVSEEDKYSEGYSNCTGIIITGTDKVSGKNISFMTHQDPKFFLKQSQIFEEDLKEKINEIKSKCLPGSIDAVAFGGQEENKLNFEEYKKSIKLLDTIILKELGIDLSVLIGPTVQSTFPMNVYFKTKDRQAYIIRRDLDFSDTNDPYVAKDIDEYISKIRKIVSKYLE